MDKRLENRQLMESLNKKLTEASDGKDPYDELFIMQVFVDLADIISRKHSGLLSKLSMTTNNAVKPLEHKIDKEASHDNWTKQDYDKYYTKAENIANAMYKLIK
jgi:hypothetical protein